MAQSKILGLISRPERKFGAALALAVAVSRATAADDGQANIMRLLRNPVFG
jgi:hypothetical protein